MNETVVRINQPKSDNQTEPQTPIPDTDVRINHEAQRYPFCIVWTPIPFLTWFFPFIGHMGIAMSSGIIRDFAGPYFVSTDRMAFGKPTRYWRLNPLLAKGEIEGWDRAVTEASELYMGRMHNLFCDNCHSHVANALNRMAYDKSSSWNMIKLAFLMFIKGKYVGVLGVIKSWLPFFIIVTAIVLIAIFT